MLNNLGSRGIKTKVRDFLMIRTESIMYMSSIAFREKTIYSSAHLLENISIFSTE